MATPDHTVLARPPNPLGDKSIQSIGRPRRVTGTVGKSRQQLTLRLAAINAAMNDIALLVVESEEARSAEAHGEPMRSGCWPLPQLCAENLVAAIRLLNQYAELLSHEPLVES